MPAILVVDDEPLIREMLALVLEREGFAVYCAADGAEALHKYRLHRDEIELVISDCIMPRVDGPTLAARLAVERPELPMILMSDTFSVEDLDPNLHLQFLPKPFDISGLLSAVHSLIPESKSVSTT